jgi:hypothetical protein
MTIGEIALATLVWVEVAFMLIGLALPAFFVYMCIKTGDYLEAVMFLLFVLVVWPLIGA